MKTDHVVLKGWNHWDVCGLDADLDCYIYEDVFEPHFFKSLKNLTVSYFTKKDTKTFRTHNTFFTHENKVNKIISHKQNGREQHVIFDLTLEKEYEYQTQQTVREWGKKFLSNNISPIFYKVLETIENLEPFSLNKEYWLPYRHHLNVLSYTKCLSLHHDAEPRIWRGDIRKTLIPIRTTTVYLDELDKGGEFFTLNGFVYKPKANTILNINGAQVMHGVSSNMDSTQKTRYAFSIRWAPIEYLFLPGHPDKFLYKNYDSSNNI